MVTADTNVWARAGLEKTIDHRRAAVQGGQHERCRAGFLFDIHVCAAPDQQVGCGEIVPVRGPMERGRSVCLWRVHIHALFDQRLNGSRVVSFCGINQADVGCPGRSGKRQPQNAHADRCVRPAPSVGTGTDQTRHRPTARARERRLNHPRFRQERPAC